MGTNDSIRRRRWWDAIVEDTAEWAHSPSPERVASLLEAHGIKVNLEGSNPDTGYFVVSPDFLQDIQVEIQTLTFQAGPALSVMIET